MTIQDDEQDQLREALRDLGYSFGKELGIIWLIRRLGATPKPWIREREIRDLHRSITPEQQAKLDQANHAIATSLFGGITLEEATRRMNKTTAILRGIGRHP